MACATLKRSWEFDPVHSPGRPSKRPRCTAMCVSPTTSSSPPPAKKSNFEGRKMTPDEMAASIRFEMERLKRHRSAESGECGEGQMGMNMSPSHSGSEGSNSDSDGMPMSPEPHASTSGPKLSAKSLFTFKQVQRICARVVKEREEQVRQEYDAILNNKLQEQYEMFVRFSRDQIHRHFSPESTPSYLS